MVVQVLIRLTLYVDFAIFRRKPQGVQQGIGNTVRNMLYKKKIAIIFPIFLRDLRGKKKDEMFHETIRRRIAILLIQ